MTNARFLWLAIASSTVIYMFILYTLHPTPPRPFEESVRATTTLVLYAAAFLEFVTGLVYPVLKKSAPRHMLITTMALFASCAFFGVFAAFLQQDWRVYLPAWLLAIAGFIRAFPKNEQVTT